MAPPSATPKFALTGKLHISPERYIKFRPFAAGKRNYIKKNVNGVMMKDKKDQQKKLNYELSKFNSIWRKINK